MRGAGAILWDGESTWVLLEGHAPDVAAEREVLAAFGRFTETGGPPALPGQRWSLSPGELRRLGGPGRTPESAATGDEFVAVVGVGLVFAARPQPLRAVGPATQALADRMKANFDPTGRMNPGRNPYRR
jgi:glycolate oxidase FAD binding subunit